MRYSLARAGISLPCCAPGTPTGVLNSNSVGKQALLPATGWPTVDRTAHHHGRDWRVVR
jgi:hypothetical protein